MLVSSPEAVVTTTAPEITIEPPSPATVYVPVCDPSLVYGAWPYPDYPPDTFADVGVPVGAFGCGWVGAPIVGPLWGWNRWNWRQHRVFIDRDKIARLNGNRPPAGEGANGNRPRVGEGVGGYRPRVGEGIGGNRPPVGEGVGGNRPPVGEGSNDNRLPVGDDGAWRYDPFHRHRVPYNDPGLRARFPVAPVEVRAFPGAPAGAAHEGVTVPAAGPSGVHAWPTEIARPPIVNYVPPAFGSTGFRPDARIESERGYSSRMSPGLTPRGFVPNSAPSGVAPHFGPSGVAPHFAPSIGAPQFARPAGTPRFAPSGVAPQFTPSAGAGIR